MNEASAAHLVPKCRELRAAYLGSLKQYSSDPKKFESEVAVAIKNNTTPAPAYHAILMAAAFEDTRLEPALQARAKLEQAKKWRLQYASAALERIKTGRCGHAYDDPAYVEICRVTSPVAKRLVDWAKAGR